MPRGSDAAALPAGSTSGGVAGPGGVPDEVNGPLDAAVLRSTSGGRSGPGGGPGPDHGPTNKAPPCMKLTEGQPVRDPNAMLPSRCHREAGQAIKMGSCIQGGPS